MSCSLDPSHIQCEHIIVSIRPDEAQVESCPHRAIVFYRVDHEVIARCSNHVQYVAEDRSIQNVQCITEAEYLVALVLAS
jgi:hypothetical protein